MNIIILILLINSLVIWGFHIATEEGMILNFVRRWTANFPMWIQKPLCLCVSCMASVHGTWFFALIVQGCGLQIETYYLLPIYILALAGTVNVVGKFIE